MNTFNYSNTKSGRDESRPDRTPEAAFEQGMKAYRRGEVLSDNPYRNRSLFPELAPRWADGFREAEAMDDS